MVPFYPSLLTEIPMFQAAGLPRKRNSTSEIVRTSFCVPQTSLLLLSFFLILFPRSLGSLFSHSQGFHFGHHLSVVEKKSKISTLLYCKNPHLPQQDLLVTDSDVRHAHVDLTIINKYKHEVFITSKRIPLLSTNERPNWQNTLTLKRKLCFSVSCGLQCSINCDFHSSVAPWK